MARKDWKKQLFRVKQIADQNLGRVEKTEALTSDLQVLEKRVEQYGKIFSSTGKKLLSCLQGQPGQDIEKRQKKLPEYAFANNLIEGSSQLGIDTLVGQVFQICGDAESHVANKTLQHELNIENVVLAPIHNLIDNDIPAIQKHKKNLQRVVLDMDSAKTRYTSAMKEQAKGSSNNPGSAKVDSLRDEYEEACYRVDQCRDQLATEMFTLASREAELSSILLELVKSQASYHKQCLETLERRIPQIEEQIEFHTHMPVYGKPMDDHLRRTKRTIALVIEECIKNLISLGGMEEEGLFRIAGAANKVKKLKAAFNSEQCADIAEEYDVHCIAGALKLYLRELPDPLMTSALYPNWMQAAHLPADQRLAALAEVVGLLPKLHYENLRFLIKFLSKLSELHEVNKMSPSNIAIVMGPNLIWPEGESGPSVLTTSTQSAIVEALISHCDYFFPGDIDFHQYASQTDQDSPTANIRREKPDKPDKPLATTETGSKRHGLNAGLSMAHNSLIVPMSTPAAPKFNINGSHLNNPDKVTIKLEGESSGSDTKDDVVFSGMSVSYRDRPSCSPVSKSGSNTDVDSNGRYKKSCSVSDGDGIRMSDTTGSKSRLNTRSLVGLDGPETRAITPPPKGPPPRGMHSDVYNTVFALQSLGNGWPDYLSRVRTLWDGHMDQRNSFVGSNGVGSSQSLTSTGPVGVVSPGTDIRAGTGSKSDEDYLEQIVNNNNLHGQAPQPDLLNSMPQGVGAYQTPPQTQPGKGPDMIQGHGSQGHLPIQSLIGSVHSSPTSPLGSQENMSASIGSLDMLDAYVGSKSVGASPKPPRRVNKKPAPMPPPERPQGPAPPPPVASPPVADKPVLGPSSMSVPPPGPPVQSPPIADKPPSAGSLPGANLPYPIKPPLPGRPVTEQQPQAAPRPDRPPSPTRRPTVPPPERPQPAERPTKPDKPGTPATDKIYPSLSPTTVNVSSQPKKSSSVSSGDHSPPQAAKIILNAVFDTAEKPPLRPPPAVKPDSTVNTPQDEVVLGHKRQGSSGGRPPRPHPPAPPNKPSLPQDMEDINQSSSVNIPSDVPPSPGPQNTYL